MNRALAIRSPIVATRRAEARASEPESSAPLDRLAHHFEDVPVQADGVAATRPDEVHAAAALGTSGQSGPLPFRDSIQRAFGHHDVSSLAAFTDAKASEGARRMGARAFTTRAGVAFRGTPDLHTVAHEAAHAVQQRGGVQLAGGVGREGDAYERHADAAADLVVRGRSAEALLDRGAATGGETGPAGAVQRKMGFEFESGTNQFTEALPRKEVVYETDAITLEADGPGTHMEFVTKPFDGTEQILDAVREAATLASALAESRDGEKKVSRAEGGAWKRDVSMVIKDRRFFASPQHTEGVTLANAPTYIRDYLGDGFADAIGAQATTATSTSAPSDAVKGLLHAVLMYVRRAQTRSSKPPSKEGPKVKFRLMARTHFRAMFQSLTDPDQEVFRSLAAGIPDAVGLTKSSRVFQQPYVASDDGSVTNAGPKLGEWLTSIMTRANRHYDLLSPPPGIVAHKDVDARSRYGMGAYGMDGTLALFEMRGHRVRNKQLGQFDANSIGKIPAAQWLPWAASIVALAEQRGAPSASSSSSVEEQSSPSSSVPSHAPEVTLPPISELLSTLGPSTSSNPTQSPSSLEPTTNVVPTGNILPSFQSLFPSTSSSSTTPLPVSTSSSFATEPTASTFLPPFSSSSMQSMSSSSSTSSSAKPSRKRHNVRMSSSATTAPPTRQLKRTKRSHLRTDTWDEVKQTFDEPSLASLASPHVGLVVTALDGMRWTLTEIGSSLGSFRFERSA